MGAGANTADLDFDSVQRGNAEIERRAQEVIDRCWQLGADNPILSIHDVGAGGLSNALPEIVHSAGRGARLDLRAVPSEDSGMSPREIWCNEAQERYVLAIAPESLERLRALAERERCPFAVLGAASADGWLRVADPLLGHDAVDVDLDVILGKPPRMLRDVTRAAPAREPFALDGVESWQPGDGGDGYVLTVADVRRAAPPVTRALVAAGADVLSIAEVRHSLEDVYLELIGEDVEAAR